MFDTAEIKNILETLLFVARKPLTCAEIENIIGVPADALSGIFEELILDYQNKGLQIVKIAHGYQICTREKYSAYIDKLIASPIEVTLSDAALEVLAIISYKQPITRLEIETIRGVISDSAINTLLEKRLIKEVGRSDSVGRAFLYGTTDEFLRHFGLKDLTDLPKIDNAFVDSTQQKLELVASEN